MTHDGSSMGVSPGEIGEDEFGRGATCWSRDDVCQRGHLQGTPLSTVRDGVDEPPQQRADQIRRQLRVSRLGFRLRGGLARALSSRTSSSEIVDMPEPGQWRVVRQQDDDQRPVGGRRVRRRTATTCCHCVKSSYSSLDKLTGCA